MAALSIAAIATIASLCNIDFPLGTHVDEIPKVDAVLTGAWSYRHPLLMIDIVRGANWFFGFTDPQAVAELGRSLAGISTGLLVFATWILARTVLADSAALAAAAVTAALPLTCVHALFFKEDAFVAPWIVLSLAALIHLLTRPTIFGSIVLGLCIGLASGAKYVGALVTLPFAIAMLLSLRPRDLAFSAGLSLTVTLVAILVFLTVQIPGLFEISRMVEGMRAEVLHAVDGDDVPILVSESRGLFHLRESLLPGMGISLLTFGVVGLISPMLVRPERRMACIAIAAFVAAWYVLHELSPLKPYPGFQRYMHPIGPLLVILAAVLIDAVSRRLNLTRTGLLVPAILLIAAFPALLSSVRIMEAIRNDPRRVTTATVAALSQRPAFDTYTTYRPLYPPPLTALLPAAADHVVVSSLYYDRFIEYGMDPQQPAAVRERTQYYKALFRLPYLEISSGGPSFGFLNPKMWIVRFNGDAASLQTVADAILAADPGLELQIVLPPSNGKAAPINIQR